MLYLMRTNLVQIWCGRSSGQVLFCMIVISQKIKQWNQFLSSGENKMQLISFTVNQWNLDRSIKNIESNIFYATGEDKCYHISRVGMVKDGSLLRYQEEADPRIFLHVKYSLQYS